ncbi:alkane hydroxylase MAH1-like [Abrus precatorius]|uniref:Alkane hydroxylase MAH1-like n=1 Tax=Abrus precatorius TaxID=3816 RepID=A0A8B8M3E0_ABRPR|nr:alkane hydroxylase MAH1-like [Abrus precatorius]
MFTQFETFPVQSTTAMLVYIGLFVSIVFFIFFWSSRRNGNKTLQKWPIIGMLPAILQNLSNIHDYTTLALKQYGGTALFEGPWFSNSSFIITSDPMNVHHITSKNFGNYGKGSNFNEIFEIFGGGIFNADFHAWKQERTILHSLLRRKSFEIFLQQTIQKKLENCLIPFLEHASKARTELDLQDAFQRFTFDTTCSIVFGFDPNCLPKSFSELSHFAYEKALIVMEDVVFYRHIIPRWLWKLQEWLQIGPEKKFKEAKENFEKFLHECIASKLEEKRRCNSTKEVDESQYGLLRGILEERAEKGQVMDDKYIRDTAFGLVAAGSGTVSAGLSWFFWLVSTHPHVEAKLLQEIRDNCLSQEGNWVVPNVEKFGKLVYLHGAVCETLRLFPSLPFDHKCAIKSDILPSGDHVSPNTVILYSLYAMGRMEQIWGDDYLEFKPERWISERGDVVHIPSYKFIAFNAGPRSCLGKDITLIEMKMVAATILWKFHMQVVDGHPIAPRLSVVLSMEHGLKVKVTERCIS